MTALSYALRSRRIAVAVAVAAAVSAIMTLTATLVLARPAGALPLSQTSCAMGTITITPASGWVPLTGPLSAFIVNTDRIKAEATADVGVPAGAEVRLGWSVLGTAPSEGTWGPANFADHQEFFATRSTFALIGIGTGPATVQPFVRLSGPAGATATLLHRCASAEGQTS
jgi:hypothetical protein